MVGEPASMTAMCTVAGRWQMMISNVPPCPVAVCWTALVASSLVSRAASAAGPCGARVRWTNRRACATCAGSPGKTRRPGRVAGAVLVNSAARSGARKSVPVIVITGPSSSGEPDAGGLGCSGVLVCIQPVAGGLRLG